MSENQIHLSGVHQTPRAGLCALGVSLHAKHFFAPLEAQVHIDEKELVYPPIDKLKVCFIGLLGGISGLYLSNKVVRADPTLRRCWGCSTCAEQSTIHRTLVACTPDTVTQLRTACTDVFQQYSQACRHDFQHGLLILDLDLQGQRTSKHAEQATKGYFPGRHNAYGRQLARVVAAQYDEVIVDHLYPGNTALGPLIPTLVEAHEGICGCPGRRTELDPTGCREACRQRPVHVCRAGGCAFSGS